MKHVDNQPNIQALRKISSLFATADLEIDHLLSLAIDTATETIGARNSSLLLVDDNSGHLQFYQASGQKKIQLKNFEIPPGMGLAGAVLENGEPIVSNDVVNDPRWYSYINEKISFQVTAIATLPLIIENQVIGVVQFLDKIDNTPFSEKDVGTLEKFANMMAAFINTSQSKKILGREFDRLRQKYMRRYMIVGESKALRKCIMECEKVANSKAAVLISGESGTGKELFANMIHDRSNRQTKPFISVNCGALPDSILERELFGHEKGAFTGADSRKIGLFEAAHTGTLFLDEIGEMPLEMQVKLLRVIQEGSFMRLGGTTPIQVDVRIISATNQNLEKCVAEGLFRKDLYYRINVINIKLPSLRERKEDIPDLTSFFLKKHSRDGENPVKCGKEVLSYLMSYSWPGNIRQLENVVERALVLCDGDELTKESFEFEAEAPSIDVGVGQSLKEANDAFRRCYISKTLSSTDGNRTKAAKILKVQRSYLSRLIKELGID